MPTEDELRALGCDGWRDDEATAVTLHLPVASDAPAGDADGATPMLRLVDDDKQAGLTQATITDLFLRLALRSSSGAAPQCAHAR